MVKHIIKRNKEKQEFNKDKIYNAIFRAVAEVAKRDKVSHVNVDEINVLTNMVVDEINARNVEAIDIEDVQDIVESMLIKRGHDKTAKAYILYREKQAEKRDLNKNILDKASKIFQETDKLNANIVNSPMGKMLQIGSTLSKEYACKNVLSKEFVHAHDTGDIHIHDLDFLLLTINCLQIPAKRLLSEGFNVGYAQSIRPAKRIDSAASLSAILIQASQNDMFGGQSIPSFDSALGQFVKPDTTDREVYQAMESLVHNLNTMHSRAGAQVPFSSLNVGLDTSEGARRVTKNLLLAYEAGLGHGETPIFPNVLFKVRKGVNRFPEDPNYDLFQIAIRVASRRMNPTFVFMDTTFNSPFDSVDYMGCRTRVVNNVNGPEQCESRGNLFFVTMNLPRLAILANKNIDKFWELLESRMDLCYRQLMERYNIVKNFKVRDIPFVMGQHLYMGSEGLGLDDTIEKAIRNGTISMGFIGLAETLKALIGKHHGESEEAFDLGIQIVSRMHDKMNELTEKTGLNFSLFATPAEGLSGRFTKMDRELFGEIEGVTDREYYTNSFHVPVYHTLTHYKKIEIEGAFHKYCTAGHISYVEYDAPPINNLRAVEKELNHMADSDIGYAGINFPIDFCANTACGYTGVIDEDECPICGCQHIRRIRRITGYLSELNNFNDAKFAEQSQRTTNRR